ncbi:MAG: hypothetical protein QF864_09895, partial [SAR202 cluster bacterium]|nr:hypothetical protein [SAR202 cluster bacterium]
ILIMLSKKISDVCVVIQARLGSHRFPNKMLRPFAGTTLVDILLKKLKSSKVIPQENIYFSVYEEELKEAGRKHNINIFDRSLESSNSEGQPLYELYDWYDKLPYKYVVLLNACNPLLKVETIDDFFQKYLQSDRDGMFTVFEKKTYYWDSNEKAITDWGGSTIMNTKFVDPIYEASYCIFSSKMSIIGDNYWMDTNSPANPKLYVMDELEAFDIDYNWQFEVGEILYKKFK